MMTTSAPDTALLTLAMVARHHGVDISVDRIVHDYAIAEPVITTDRLVRIARDYGFHAKASGLDWDKLSRLGEAFPVIARLSNGNSIVVAGFRTHNGVTEAVVVDPLASGPGFIFIGREAFETQWKGETVLVKRRYRLNDETRPFGLAWFVPEVLRQRGALAYVVVAGLTLLVIGLVTPLFFQMVIDKVLVHNSESTLVILGIGVTIAAFFEMAMGFLRNFLLLHATSKIDIRLAMRTFEHMLSLPLHFFESSSAGVTTKHMQQAERVREFLTGRLLSVFMDSWGLVVFLPILLMYSPLLTSVVLFFSGLVALSLLVVMPMFRRELENLYSAEGQRQALLVETIHGMPAVKALALEPGLRQRWSQNSALAVTMQVRVGRISIGAQALVGGLEKLCTIAIIWIGALKVFDGSLSVGALIAIQMLASRVSSPLVQIVSLINDAQQTALSVRMLGEIMNRKPEQELTRAGLRPPLKGGIVLDGVSFYYPGMPSPALNGIGLTIPAGAMVGVVGRSGSGKSTFLRLLQGLYQPQSGTIRFDGHDIREIDLAHLRRSLGVVLQDSFIFRGTVRENIAIAMPGASFSEVVTAASLAGADEFILRLPQGYETLLEENASNLSGGQKQRLAIARALLTQPPILIFDEATSALDPESEAIVQRNMAAIGQGRTVIMVSHRLASLTGCDSIIVFDGGTIVDCAPHQVLLQRCALYRHLSQQQVGHVQ
jgi:ATP-binding cassette subfamily B protein